MDRAGRADTAPRRSPSENEWVIPDAPLMPRGWDLTPEEAEGVLVGLGVPVTVQRAQSTVVREGGLITVAPPPGTPLDNDTEAILTVSSGPPNGPTEPH